MKAHRFNAETMTKSLHTSLRALRTDYVDFLLLHEPSAEVLTTAEPLAFLERMKREGKVRHFGIAAHPDVAAYGVSQAQGYTPVLQLPNSVFHPAWKAISPAAQTAIFAHSVLGTSFGRLAADLQSEETMADRWSRVLQADVKDRRTLVRLALQWAFAAVPRSVVLVTSIQEAHVREDVAAVRTAASAEQLQRLEQLVAEWMGAGHQPSLPAG